MDTDALLLLNSSRLKEIEAKLSAAYVMLESAPGVSPIVLELVGDAFSLTTFAAGCNRQIVDNLRPVEVQR